MRAASSPVGNYPITATLLDAEQKAGNYALIFNEGTLTVTPANLTVVANDSALVYGSSNPIFNGTISGLRNGDDISASYSCPADSSSPVGTYPINVDLHDANATLANYLVTTNAGTLSVTAAALTVSADNQSRIYGASNPTLTGVISGLQNSDNITAIYSTTATLNTCRIRKIS